MWTNTRESEQEKDWSRRQMEDLLSMKCKNCSSSYSTSTRDVKRIPLVLWCGCTFCAGCLGQLCRGGGIKCPHCRRKTVVLTDVDLKDQLAPNYYLLGRITAKNLKLPRFPVSSVLSKFISTSTSTASLCNLDLDIGVPSARQQQSCDECGALGSIQCQQCTGIYCQSCFKTVHMSSNSMRRHTAVPLSQLQSGPTHCPTHQALLLDYYCTDDAVCVCSQCCITGDHKGHQVVPLNEIAESQREKLLPLINEAKNGMRVLRTDSERVSDRLSVCRKEIRTELGRLEKQFSRSYTLLQLHQQKLTEQFCSTAIDAITPLKNMETEVHAQMQSVLHKVMVGEEALRDDYVLMQESSSLIDSLSSGVQLPLKQQFNDVAVPKVSLDLGPFKQYLSEKFGTISANTKLNKSEVDGNDILVVVSGLASPAHPVTTPTSSRPPSALSECYLSGAIVGSERGSRASSYRSVSPASPPRKPHLPVHKVNIDDTIEVWICHVVSVGEFYVQCLEQRLALEQLSLSISSLSPGPLSADNLKEGMKCVGVLDEMWYRAQVTSIDLSAPVCATVKLIDCGRMENLPLTSLYELPFDLSVGAPQCTQCCLHAVHPPKVRYQHHVTPTLWSPNTSNIFTALVKDKNFRMKVYRQLSSGVISVDLLSFNGPGTGRGESSRGSGSEGETNECTSVISQLIERGVAVLDNRKWAEPNTLSVNLGAGDCMDVTVSTAENPWDFYVHLVAGEKDRQRIADVLSQHIGRLCPVTLSPYKNMLCCCEYSEDGTFYRGRVKELCGDGDVVIEFVDYGNCEQVPQEELFELPGDLLTTPIQAVHCRLDNVHPAGGGPQSKWSEDASDQFNGLVGYPLYSMSVKEMGMPLSVELVDKETGQSLSDLLVEKKLAEYIYSLKRSQSKSPGNGIQLASLVQPDLTLHHSKLPLSRRLDAVGDKSLMISPSLAPTIPPTAIPPAQPPAVGETITAKVVHISSPTHFYVQRLNTNLLSELNRIRTIKVKTFKNIKPGAACLARFQDDEDYHRVVVLSVKSNMVEVCYVDYGNSAEVSLDQLYPLTPELTRQPSLALPCSLAREIPQNMLPVFSELVVDKMLSVTVKGVDGGPPTVLLVSLVDESGEDIEKLLSSFHEKREEDKEREKESVREGGGANEVTLNGTTASPELVTMTVCVTYVSPYGVVYGHDVSPGSSTTASLRTIEQAIELRCSTPSPQLPSARALDLGSGQAVCAKSEDGVWYRATVKTVQDTNVTVYYVDYGNCEIIKEKDIIPEAVHPDLPPQAVALKFIPLFKSLLNQPAERQTTPPATGDGQQQVNEISMAEEQHYSLSQLLIDKCITALIRGTDDRGLLTASCDVIDSWIKQQESKN